jgi:hypothetical protein
MYPNMYILEMIMAIRDRYGTNNHIISYIGAHNGRTTLELFSI